MPVLFNALRQGRKPIELSLFMSQNKHQLHNKRAIYLIATRQDNPSLGAASASVRIMKVGIAGTRSGKPTRRMREYIIAHGTPHRTYTCRGVYLFFFATTHWRPEDRIPQKMTKVYKVENAFLKHAGVHTIRGRGLERVHVNADTACTLIDNIWNSRHHTDTTLQLRRSGRRAAGHHHAATPNRNRLIWFRWSHKDNTEGWYGGKVVDKSRTHTHVDYASASLSPPDIYKHRNEDFVQKKTWVYQSECATAPQPQR